MVSRLKVIEQDLVDRRARAEDEGWKGEIEGIDLTLSLLRQKHDEAVRLSGLSRTVHLSMPSTSP